MPNLTRRTWTRARVLLPLFLVFLAAPVRVDAQEGAPRKRCYKCRGTGKLEVEVPSIEQQTLHCSHHYRHGDADGVGFTLCDRCNHPEARFEYEDRLAVHARWLEDCERFEKAAGIKEGVLLETEHIRLFYALPSISYKRKRYDMHRGAHDYLKLLERTYAEYRRIFDVESESPSPKHEIFILDDRNSFSRFLKTFRGSSGMNIAGMKFRGDILWFVTWRDPDNLARDELLREKVVHNFGHLLVYKYRSRVRDLPTWLDTGFANYMERWFSNANRNTCFIEVPPPGVFKEGGGWRSRLKKDAITKKQMPFVEFYDKDLNAYDYRDMAYAWSYVDFFFHYDPAKFRALVDAIKEGSKSLDAVREVYGWLPPELTDAWRTYVLKRY